MTQKEIKIIWHHEPTLEEIETFIFHSKHEGEIP